VLRAAAVLSISSFILVLWFKEIRPNQQHSAAYLRLESTVKSLASKRPLNVNRKQWSYLVGWTLNGISNCCSVRQFLKDDDGSQVRFRRFVEELELKLQGDVTPETIDWIWDQFALVSRYGEHYSQNYRPTTAERLMEAEYISTGVDVQ